MDVLIEWFQVDRLDESPNDSTAMIMGDHLIDRSGQEVDLSPLGTIYPSVSLNEG